MNIKGIIDAKIKIKFNLRNRNNGKERDWRNNTLTISSDIIIIITNAQELQRFNMKSTRSTALQNILATKTSSCYKKIKINPNPVLRNLIIIIPISNAPPIHASIASAVFEHQLQRIHGLRMIRAARTCPQRRRTLRHVRAQVTRTVTRRVAPVREPPAEHRLGRDHYVVLAAVEEEVVVKRGNREVGFRVEYEGSGGAEILTVLAGPHVRVGD